MSFCGELLVSSYTTEMKSKWSQTIGKLVICSCCSIISNMTMKWIFFPCNENCAKIWNEKLQFISNFNVNLKKSWESFHVSFLHLGSGSPANWSDKDSFAPLMSYWESEKELDLSQFGCWWKKDFLVNVFPEFGEELCDAKARRWRLPFEGLPPQKIQIEFLNERSHFFAGEDRRKKEPKGIPSQQLPSFMFLSWSWVLWKIFLHINVIYDATCSSQCCVHFFLNKVSLVRRWI